MFVYVYRNLLARAGTNLVTGAAVALVVLGCLVELSFLEGFRRTIDRNAPPENVVVVAAGATTEQNSELNADAVQALSVLQGVEMADGRPLISLEIRTAFPQRTGPERKWRTLMLRGVDPIAARLHDVQVVEGRAPQPGTNEVMVGRGLAERFTELAHLGAKVEGDRPIVGIFDAHGSVCDNEIWADRGRMATELRRDRPGIAFVRAASPEAVDAIVRALRGTKLAQVWADSERNFREEQLNARRLYVLVLTLVLSLTAVAIFTTTSALYASFLARIKEFAILNILGVNWSKVGWIIMQESLLITLGGSLFAVGVGLLLVNGANASTLLGSELVFRLHIGLPLILQGLAVGIGIGFLGSLVPIALMRRLDVVRASR